MWEQVAAAGAQSRIEQLAFHALRGNEDGPGFPDGSPTAAQGKVPVIDRGMQGDQVLEFLTAGTKAAPGPVLFRALSMSWTGLGAKALREFRNAAGLRYYAVQGEAVPAGYDQTGLPLARVWPDVERVTCLDVDALPVGVP